MSISIIINQLLECGFEAVVKELLPEMANKVKMIIEDQIKRPLIGEKIKAEKKPKSLSSK
ncbi:hypothetical protein [Nitrosomonas sp. Nm33]|uniref:hypothetical protein n=1 Tax=Nitrosomonas sp. Nm33 TaxID=133724 RepID=UPI000B870CC4|nr:hypothetical protein [Nitrosomonas sp. Nm33]